VVRDPPRKSEQATHWAVCSRVRRAQRRRLREPTACTERRFRNGRRLHCLWLSSPQRKRSRVLVAPSSGDPKAMEGRGRRGRRGGGYDQRRASRKLDDHQKTRNLRGDSPKNDEGMELSIFSLGSDCSKCASVAHNRSICFGFMISRNRMPTISTRSRLEVLSWYFVWMRWTGRGTRGRLGYLLSSYTLVYYWSRFYLLPTWAGQHSLCVWESHTLKIVLPELQPLES
jgi:hypothetical protein